ncbi:MAG TPA: hypothetical protein DCY91_29750 [Cyanobacteria bacterium UBA11370]|nr:hypothetical protein [Cyanobacteria bacterium UBA11370]HBY78817.1 hypothetical protein [Cyanobacteria bacterium UBA11148]
MHGWSAVGESSCTRREKLFPLNIAWSFSSIHRFIAQGIYPPNRRQDELPNILFVNPTYEASERTY